jgi:hypothetical protein
VSLRASVSARVPPPFVGEDCHICYMSEIAESDIAMRHTSSSSSYDCAMPFCTGCAARHIITRLKDHVDPTVPCPCGAPDAFMLYRSMVDVLQREDSDAGRAARAALDRRRRTSALLSLPHFRWCAHPECSDGQECGGEGAFMTCRTCGGVTCIRHERPAAPEGFTALAPPLDPAAGLVRSRREQCCPGFAEDAAETDEWLRRNTKPCPRCKVRIEKNGGCRHMTCKNADCGHEFFWCCLRAYRSQEEARQHYRECP